jgi:hypothetical protein
MFIISHDTGLEFDIFGSKKREAGIGDITYHTA